jgi:hypothetical protein
LSSTTQAQDSLTFSIKPRPCEDSLTVASAFQGILPQTPSYQTQTWVLPLSSLRVCEEAELILRNKTCHSVP